MSYKLTLKALVCGGRTIHSVVEMFVARLFTTTDDDDVQQLWAPAGRRSNNVEEMICG